MQTNPSFSFLTKPSALDRVLWDVSNRNQLTLAYPFSENEMQVLGDGEGRTGGRDRNVIMPYEGTKDLNPTRTVPSLIFALLIMLVLFTLHFLAPLQVGSKLKLLLLCRDRSPLLYYPNSSGRATDQVIVALREG